MKERYIIHSKANKAAQKIREYFNTPKWRQIKKDRKEQDGKFR